MWSWPAPTLENFLLFTPEQSLCVLSCLMPMCSSISVSRGSINSASCGGSYSKTRTNLLMAQGPGVPVASRWVGPVGSPRCLPGPTCQCIWISLLMCPLRAGGDSQVPPPFHLSPAKALGQWHLFLTILFWRTDEKDEFWVFPENKPHRADMHVLSPVLFSLRPTGSSSAGGDVWVALLPPYS